MPTSAILKCNICPKKPNFSDVSHLLTHISSKGHLSHYFKLQVRSHQEPEAGDLLAEYDQWYMEHNLAGLLSERMIAKETRKGKGRSSTAHSNATSRRTSTAMLPSAHYQPQNQHSSVPSYVDPGLSQQYGDMTGSHASDPRVQLWPSVPLRRSLPTRSSTQRAWKVGSPGSEDGEPDSPLAPRRANIGWSAHTRVPTGRPSHRPTTPDPFLDDDASYEDDDEEGEHREDVSKLKGILWPGMDIFDSATEQMRRKRNQKKDGSVLKQMEKTSETVEPTELVFSPSGTLRKARHISGMVDDSSPLKGETPIPKKRVARPRRQPLAPTNPNRMMRSHSKLRRKGKGKGSLLEQECFPGQPYSFGEPPRFGGNFVMQDDDLTYSAFNPKSSRGFEIFQDGSDLHNRGHHSGSRHYYNPLVNHQPRASASNYPSGLKHFSGKGAHLPEYRGKENIEPALTQRLDGQYMEPNWDTAHLDGRYAAQYMYGTGFQGYSSFNENDTFGYSANPLSCSLAQIQRNGDQKQGSGVLMTGFLESPQHKEARVGREVSPDGTVSDIDQDDIGRMYLNELTA